MKKTGTGTVYQNTAYLYLLTFSNYIFSFLTIPYQTRVLGVETFGKVGFGIAFYTYFALLFDFGFILSGTRDVARSSGDRDALNAVLTGVTSAKLTIILVTVVVFSLAANLVDRLRGEYLFLLLYLLYAALNSLIPDFLYRGLEDMKMVAIRTVIIKFIFTVFVLIFLKEKSQYYLIPVFQLIGAAVAVVVVYWDLYTRVGLRMGRPRFARGKPFLKSSAPYFFSRVASTLYSAANTLILGFVYPLGNTVGLYSAADKIPAVAKQASSPIADSFYPYLLRTKDYKLLKKLLCIVMPVILAGCVVTFVFSEQICLLAFGQEYAGAGEILRCMVPVMALCLPVYLFGFPALTPLHMEKWANYSVEIASVVQVAGLCVLFAAGRINARTVSILTCISETVTLIIRVGVFTLAYRREKETLWQ